jgi:hypothetical protein
MLAWFQTNQKFDMEWSHYRIVSKNDAFSVYTRINGPIEAPGLRAMGHRQAATAVHWGSKG